MSVGDVLAHYSGGEGLTALLGGMEHATLESISIENSARHTQTPTDRQKKSTHTHSPPGLSPLLSSLRTLF